DLQFTRSSEDSHRAPQAPCRSHSGKRKTVEILRIVAHSSQRVTSDLEAQSAAVPVIRCLSRAVLQLALNKVIADAASHAQACFGCSPVARSIPQLVVLRSDGKNRRSQR